jgi:hypothetical protein
VNEMFASLSIIEEATGRAYHRQQNNSKTILSEDEAIAIGKQLLTGNHKLVDELEITVDGFENSKRKVIIAKARIAYHLFIEIIRYYGCIHLLDLISEGQIKSLEALKAAIPSKLKRGEWVNIGGQLITTEDHQQLKEKIKTGKIKSWDDVHAQYTVLGNKYPAQKRAHALASLAEITEFSFKKLTQDQLSQLFNSALTTKEWMTKGIHDSRAKDYQNPFRKMVYESFEEMNVVVGKLEDNSFIQQQLTELTAFKQKLAGLKKTFKIK